MSDTESGILEWINRRQISPDMYRFINSSSDHGNCDNENSTYLISDNQCVNDQELLNGCSHVVVPVQSLRPTTIAQLVSSTQKFNVTYLLIADNTTNNSAIFKFNETNQTVNSSLCNISSLAVYRGRDQAIEISHDGFSLNYNGNIEINRDQLGYSLEEYMGEVYHVNLSCSVEGLPENGCLFFRVFGQTNVTNAKFNCTVPGTRYKFTKCNITTVATTVATHTDSTSDSTTITPNVTVTSKYTSLNNTTSDTTAKLETFYVLAGLGGAILVFIFCIITMCICVCLWLARRKRQVLTFTADGEQPQQQNDGERVHIQENNLPITSRTVLSDSLIVSEDTEHVYAVLEQTQLQQPTTVVQSNETMLTKQDQQTHLTESMPSNDFQFVTNRTGLKSRSATWTSVQHSTVGSKPRHENLELVQIYDNVMIETEGRSVTDTNNGPSYPGNYRKHSLLASLGGHQHSNTSQDYPVSNESDKKTDESIPIYSKPDMNKKREERRKRREQKEQEERTAALQKVSPSSSPTLPQLTENSRQQENEPPIETALGAMVDRQQWTDIDLKFGKKFSEQNNNPDDKVPMGKVECLYDEPISLNLVTKKSKNITQRKEKGKDGEEEL